MKAPLVPLVIVFSAGIAVGSIASLPFGYILLFLAVLLMLLLISIRKGMYPSIACVTAVSWFLLGMSSIAMHTQPVASESTVALYAGNTQKTIEGTVISSPHVREGKTRVVVRVDRIRSNSADIPVRGAVLLTVRNDLAGIHYGDFIRVKARLRLPRNFQNPGGFDYERYLRYQHILVTASVRKPTNIIVLRRNGGNPIMRKIEECRCAFRHVLHHAADPPERELLGALILGDKERVPSDIREKFHPIGAFTHPGNIGPTCRHHHLHFISCLQEGDQIMELFTFEGQSGQAVGLSGLFSHIRL